MSNYAKTHEYIYNQYHSTDNVVTKRSYLEILRNRANNGSSKAKEYVDKIERCKSHHTSNLFAPLPNSLLRR